MTTKMRGNQLDTGAGANQLVQLDVDSKLPAVDGSLVTGVVIPFRGARVTSVGDVSVLDTDETTISWAEVSDTR